MEAWPTDFNAETIREAARRKALEDIDAAILAGMNDIDFLRDVLHDLCEQVARLTAENKALRENLLFSTHPGDLPNEHLCVERDGPEERKERSSHAASTL
jgi:regulator of replication initiation timing